MPRLNNATQNSTRNTTQLSTFQHQTQIIQPQLIDAHLPQINQPKKIPPKPPLRKQIRHDPEGIQQIQSVTAEFHEKKTFQLAVNQQQQHLLHQTQSSSSSMTTSTTHFPNILIFGTQNFHLRHQQQQMAPNSQYLQQQQKHQMNNNMPRMNFMRNQQQQQQQSRQVHSGMIVANYSSAVDERSDPENHIYEMIDECEANGQQKKKAINSDEEMARKPEHDGNDLFQNLLRTEMLNQLQLCNGNNLRGNNGFLSHLTHEKRMDIIQETALSLASSAYVENIYPQSLAANIIAIID
ncbi:nuclear transcription factor Y subunit beta-like isoform X2 [Chironomus tepperi]|uniref:nuclear transcription factor Y subunit beta-like isoform X2 n=1 Tax=Chironomus tepperi TaxID=113505 RepID=UPI00391F0719